MSLFCRVSVIILSQALINEELILKILTPNISFQNKLIKKFELRDI